MRVAVVSPWEVDDPDGWSGTIAPMYEALQARVDAVPVRVPMVRDHLVDRAAARLVGTGGWGYLTAHAVATSRKLGRPVAEAVNASRAHVVLSVAASTALAHARLGVPVIEVGDTTFRLVTGYYPMFSRLHPLSVWQGEALARRTTRQAAGFVVASRWAARSLVEDYGVEAERVGVAPFGPGIVAASSPRGPRQGRPLRLLFVGSDWVRKGGDAAVQVLERLREDGIAAELSIVGEAPDGLAEVVRLGRVPRARMADVYASHDILLETALANAAGVTLTDSVAAGLPVVATRTGGVADIVDDGVTGVLVDARRVVPEATAAVRRLADPATWSKTSEAARRRGREVLTWDHWAETVVEACRRAVAGRH